MLSTPRPIYLKTELVLLPVDEFAFSRQTIRDLYANLAKQGGYGYENLDLQEQRPTLSTRRENGFSRCAIGKDRIIIEESNPEMPVDEFIGVVQTVLQTLGDASLPFIMQLCKIICLSQPNVLKSALPLLAGRVANVIEPIGPFRRYPSFFGVRFRFVPRAMLEEATESDKAVDGDAVVEHGEPTEQPQADEQAVEHDDIGALDPPPDNDWGQGFMEVRFETYSKNRAQLYMEATAQYPPTQEMLSTSTLDRVGRNIRETYEFLSVNCKNFLDQFDRKGEKP